MNQRFELDKFALTGSPAERRAINSQWVWLPAWVRTSAQVEQTLREQEFGQWIAAEPLAFLRDGAEVKNTAAMVGVTIFVTLGDRLYGSTSVDRHWDGPGNSTNTMGAGITNTHPRPQEPRQPEQPDPPTRPELERYAESLSRHERGQLYRNPPPELMDSRGPLPAVRMREIKDAGFNADYWRCDHCGIQHHKSLYQPFMWDRRFATSEFKKCVCNDCESHLTCTGCGKAFRPDQIFTAFSKKQRRNWDGTRRCKGCTTASVKKLEADAKTAAAGKRAARKWSRLNGRVAMLTPQDLRRLVAFYKLQVQSLSQYGLRLRLLAWCSHAHAFKEEQQARKEEKLFGGIGVNGTPFTQEASEKAEAAAAAAAAQESAAEEQELHAAKGLVEGARVVITHEVMVTATSGEVCLPAGTKAVVYASWSGLPGQKVSIAGGSEGLGWLDAKEGLASGIWAVTPKALALQPFQGQEGVVFTAPEDDYESGSEEEEVTVFHWPRPVSVEGCGQVDEPLGSIPPHRQVRIQDIVYDAGSDGMTTMLLIEDVDTTIEFDSDEQFNSATLAFDRCREPYEYSRDSEDPVEYEDPPNTAGEAGGCVVEMQWVKTNRYVNVWRKSVWVEAVDFHPHPVTQ